MPELGHQVGERGHDPARRLVDHLGRARLVLQVLQGHRVADLHRDLRAREQMGLLRIGVQQVVRAPLPDGDHRAAGLERDARGSGLADHRPEVGVAGQRALGIHHDALTGPDRRDRCIEGALGVAAQALDRDLPGSGEERREGAVLEQPGLREVARHPAVVVDEVRGRERVDVGDVVEHQDAAPGRRDLLAVDPGALRRGDQHRLEDRHGQVERPAALLLQGSHRSDRHVVPPVGTRTIRWVAPAPAPASGSGYSVSHRSRRPTTPPRTSLTGSRRWSPRSSSCCR